MLGAWLVLGIQGEKGRVPMLKEYAVGGRREGGRGREMLT